MPIYQGHNVTIIDAEDDHPFPLVRVRYIDSPDTPTEWVAADSIYYPEGK